MAPLAMCVCPRQDKYWKEAFKFLKAGSQVFDEFLPMTSRGDAIDHVLHHHANLGRLDYDTLVLEQPKPKPPPQEYTLQQQGETHERECAGQQHQVCTVACSCGAVTSS